MAKTITIPAESGFPSIDVWVNGKKYSYPTGQSVSVPDEVAAVLQAGYSVLPEPEQEPPFGRFVVNVAVDSKDNVSADKTHIEIAKAIRSGNVVMCRVDYKGTSLFGGIQSILMLNMSIAALDFSPHPIAFSGRMCLANSIKNVDITAFSDGTWQFVID